MIQSLKLSSVYGRSVLLGAALLLGSVALAPVSIANTPSAAATALFEEGKAYHDGAGVGRDLEKARALYEQAAAQGHNFARINLGYMYFTGEGVTQDYEQSRSWYYRAAIDGDADAQRMMVVFYQNGLGVIANADTAAFWQTKAETASRPALSSTVAEPVATAAPKAEASPQLAPQETKPAGGYPVKPVTEKVELPVETTPANIVNSAPASQDLSALMAAIDQTKPAAPVTAEAALETDAQSANANAAPATTVSSSATATPPVITAITPEQAARPVASKTAVALPQGASLSLIAIMAVLAFAGALWFMTQLSKLLVRRDKQRFAVAFYENHREDLRSTFLRIPEEQRLHRYIDDPWVVSVSVLMIRFAQANKSGQGQSFKFAKRIVSALRSSPLAARQEVFAIMPFIQNLIMLDINSSEHEGGKRKASVSLLGRTIKTRASDQPMPGVLLSPAE